jgi:hypothetical protein
MHHFMLEIEMLIPEGRCHEWRRCMYFSDIDNIGVVGIHYRKNVKEHHALTFALESAAKVV